MPPISKTTKLVLCMTPLTSGTSTSDQASDAVDTTGFNGCRFMVTCGTAVGTGYGITAQASTSTTVGDFASFTTSITAASTVSNRVLSVDVYKPTKRYLRVISTSTTTNDLGGVIAELYDPMVLPTTNGSTSVAAEGFGIST